MSRPSLQFDAARARTDALFELLDPVALYDRPVPERHRLIFYLGHLEAFDWNLFSQHALDRGPLHPSFDRLFAFGIDPEPGRAPSDQPSDWPLDKEVRAYVARIRSELDAAISRLPDRLTHVAIEHRLMHAETLAYLFHNLPYASKRGPAPAPVEQVPAPPKNDWVDVPAGIAVLGRPRDDGFGWDNEFDQHSVSVPEFRISRYKISNAEYLEYVRAGAPAPHFWVDRNGAWFLRAMFGEIPLPLDWPVYVTHSEASAYAQWRHAALPSEAQYHRAAEGSKAVNADFVRWDPVPVHAGGASHHGAVQMIGNGWEWTSTVFGPFAGFERFPFYPGYSADFFDGKHYVMKGASPRTAACFLRRSFRNWFRPDYPHAYAGFRLVDDT
ncbi:MAG TPA: SUMF1/EgtB/PvdO family nonheme iron enzyme [Bryobacteraceae bacterium]|nr:SUMF1/EgtB/PvdO family nonheme iron enzyme [Bryobacteraceae bacterium]